MIFKQFLFGTVCFIIRMELFAGTVLENDTLIAGTVPANNTLFAGTTPTRIMVNPTNLVAG